MFKELMTSRRFAALFWCQFLSAFNDNFLRNALIFLILLKFKDNGDLAGTLLMLAPPVFILPSFLLSALGGELADRYDKSRVAARLKLAEIPIAVLAVIGLWLSGFPGLVNLSILLMFTALFGFGCISALFGPIKYGILPDLIKESELPAGNALVEMATFIAILLGSILGGMTIAAGRHFALFGVLIIGLAVMSYLSAGLIPPTAEASPSLVVDRNILRSTRKLLSGLAKSPLLMKCALIVSWFWLMGAVMLSLQAAVVEQVFNGTAGVITAFIVFFAVGVAVGSTAAAWLAAGRIIMLPTPVAALLMGAFTLDIGWVISGAIRPEVPLGVAAFFQTTAGYRLAFDFIGLAAAGGLYVVPTFAALQAWANPENRARIVGGVNVLSSAAMALGSLVVIGIKTAGFSYGDICLLLGLCNLAIATAVFLTLPTSAAGDALHMLFRTLFRMEINGLEHIRAAGDHPVVITNHVSFLDAPLALALLDRKPVFAIDRGMSRRWWIKPFLRLVHAVAIEPGKPLATRALINEVNTGEALVIFPEGRITVTGSLMKIYDGAAMIADKTDSPVVPVRIDGLEQTPFSRLDGSQTRRRLFPKLRVTVFPPRRIDVAADIKGRERRRQAGDALYRVMSDMMFDTAVDNTTIFEAIVGAALKYGPSRVAVEDPAFGPLTYRQLLIRARVLARPLAKLASEHGAVGILLPNSVPTTACLLAVLSAGRVPAILNFTAGGAHMMSGCRAAALTSVVTSRAFVERAGLGHIVSSLGQTLRIVYLEDIAADAGPLVKADAALFWNKPLNRRSEHDTAVILFTSGSEGTPKGVALSSRNMLANIAQARARIDFGLNDKLFNVLPQFHSFGLTIGTFLPLVCGVPLYLYPSPLHYRAVPELVYDTNSTILFGTDTFLNGYARAAHPYDLRSVRYVIAGAEPIKAATRMIYLEKFGLRIFEGYGVTEAAPVLALNTPMFNRFGTVGRLLPGIETKIEPVPGLDDGGRLLVKGPNIMLGYLKESRPGVVEPPADGWYDTGDIVSVDDDGYLTIRGRAKRFAKVGGEMVSLTSVETLAAEIWPGAPAAAAVAPDARKGEKIVLFTEAPHAALDAFRAAARNRGIGEIAIPAEVIVLEHLPLLGSGKADLAALEQLARERAA
ncbi:MAG: acyl-[ACP]--phospholipid O-acyltransferase [Methylobacteriaceae bacterium]|jgi:acyl-[acyl-carrier-protein]-phospholipid O-acyltransferase/long-chain-fatty-acid--[acyl-carrier-protein] ligase|nr:acyl-[ACP]--phospholipid O-acyltransferase [Methylobacteriaceae bacterium]